MMKIMVTGATGGYGTYAIPFIKEFAPDAEVYGIARNAAKAADLEKQGIIPRIADYSNVDSLVKAFEGIERLLFISVSVHDLQKNVVKAAKLADVQFIAYTSIAGIENSKFGLEINHRATENLIVESGIKHTFLRDNWYLDMMQGMILSAAKSGKMPYIAGDGKVAWALKKDYAEVGARVITGEGYPEVLELAGKPVTYAELAEAVAEAAGHPVEAYPASQAEYTNWMMANGASQMGVMLGNSYQEYALAGNNGEEDLSPTDMEKVMGHPLRSLTEAVKELFDCGIVY